MAGKGDVRMTTECRLLAFEDYPEPIPLQGFINLLAGTGDIEHGDNQEWSRMVWDMFQPGVRWEGSDKQSADSATHRVELLINKIKRADAARWLESIGETKDTLSKQVKHWLGDCLGKPGRLTPHRLKRLALLRHVITSLKDIDPTLNEKAMPGTRNELLELCRRLHHGDFQIEVTTFKGDLENICSFRDGARRSGYYRDKL